METSVSLSGLALRNETAGAVTDKLLSFRDLSPSGTASGALCGFDLFTLFTASIIRKDVPFTR